MKILLGCGTFLGVSLALFTIYAGLNYSGFCFAKMRYLSDKERYRYVFERINQPGYISIRDEQNNENGRQYYESIPYESFRQFLESNPDCCAIISYAITPRWDWERITDFDSGEITILNYTSYYLDENGKRRSTEVNWQVIQQNCGQRHYLREPSY
ncbi:MAG: hypothetical protein F6K40_25860 [Okeania sp. SIO3I5]|uniref:hypothetical protein n=1 Tax=Okeania sp. SIO3I5 TaxID=2607805 RepID=UPI0013B5C5AE|nr:hypothetical protein [Okeania sp. SIO3I5]NEQ39498.1 hypothetical protein [Okeania sp. SIO3I5]